MLFANGSSLSSGSSVACVDCETDKIGCKRGLARGERVGSSDDSV